MAALATIRPDSWNFPLFVHVVGAMILVGGLLAAASALVLAKGDVRLLRLGYWTLWIYAREGRLDAEPIKSAWVLIGFLVVESEKHTLRRICASRIHR
jgi:hypothetical protein